MEIIPTRTDGTPFYTVTTVLDNVPATFDFQWNDREGAWYFDIYDKHGNLVVGSTKVSLSTPLFRKYILAGLPAGELMAIDTSNTDTVPGLQDLGTRVVLLYVTQADLVALAAGTFNPNA